MTRTKAGILLDRVESRTVDRTTGLRSDHVARLRTLKSAAHYPERLRRTAFRDPEDGKVLVFLTNNLILSAEIITKLYKLHWALQWSQTCIIDMWIAERP